MEHAFDRASAFPLGTAVELEDLEGDPHPTLARLRAHEAVSWLPAFDGWLVTAPALASRVMRDDQTSTVDDPRFSTAAVVGPSMLSLDGREHARHQGPFVAPFLRGTLSRTLASLVEREVRSLLDAVAPRGRAELRTTVAAPLSVAVMTQALGLAGVRIRARDLVRVSLAAANRDPAVFAEPDAYDLDRVDGRRHLTFAHGPHVCIGLHLARLEAVSAVRGSVASLPGLRLDPAAPQPVVRGLVFRKPAAVHAVWDG